MEDIEKIIINMQSSVSGITVLDAKKRCLWQTPVLVPYENGSMIELQKGPTKTVYKVIDGPVTVIFKSITCNKGDQERIRQIKEEFLISIKAHEAASDGVVVPISFSEIDDKYLPHHIIELVYEYGGDDLRNIRYM